MDWANQADYMTCRLILFRNSGSEVLVIPTGLTLCLPELEIPRRQRVAYSLTLAAKSEWDVEAIYLFPVPRGQRNQSDLPAYHAMELCRAGKLTGSVEWTAVSGLDEACFTNRDDYDSIQFAQMQAARGHSFAYFGWFAELHSWVQETIRPFGLQLNHQFQHFNGGPNFSLIRFETNGSAVWFKAVGEPNLKEFAITQKLAGLLPDYLPRLVGVHSGCNGWLSLEVDGDGLGRYADLLRWRTAADNLAALQIESIGHKALFLDAGSCNLTVPFLSNVASSFFATLSSLMERQAKDTPRPLLPDELCRVEKCTCDSLQILEQVKLPDTLGHLDLNPGNVIISQDSCVFLDWAEAYIGNPFFSLSYLLEYRRRAIAQDTGFDEQVRVAYFTRWQDCVPKNEIDEVAPLIPLLAVFAYAVAICNKTDPDGITGPKAAYLRALARRMKRESDELRREEAACFG